MMNQVSHPIFFPSNEQNRILILIRKSSHEFIAHKVNNYVLTLQSFPHLEDFRCSSD